jgi:hypothetical protein
MVKQAKNFGFWMDLIPRNVIKIYLPDSIKGVHAFFFHVQGSPVLGAAI